MSEAEFNEAAEVAKNLATRPSDKDLLELYALYKQATTGDCNTPAPGMLDLKGKAKWNTWNSKKGLSQDEARAQYVDLVKKLKA